MSHYVPVLDTPEMQRVRENQKNFSTVSNPSQWGAVGGVQSLSFCTLAGFISDDSMVVVSFVFCVFLVHPCEQSRSLS